MSPGRRLQARRSRPPRLVLANELGSEHQPFDAFISAVNLLRVASEPDRFDHGPLAQRLPSALDLQILDRDDAVAVRQEVAGGIAYFDPVIRFSASLANARCCLASCRCCSAVISSQ